MPFNTYGQTNLSLSPVELQEQVSRILYLVAP